MRFALEFHDSEVRDVATDGDAVRVRFAAASVRDAAGGRGWLPGVTLALADATLAGDPSHAFGKLAEGRLRQDGRDIARPRTARHALRPHRADAALRQRHAADRARRLAGAGRRRRRPLRGRPVVLSARIPHFASTT